MFMRSKQSLVHVAALATICVLASSALGLAQTPAQPPPAKPAPAKPAGPRAAPAPKAMTNADVIKMVQGNLGDELIAMAIRKAPRTAFDLSADGLLDLKNKGVSSAILRMMLDPTAKFEAAPAPPPGPPPAPPAAQKAPAPPAASAPANPPAESSNRSSRGGEQPSGSLTVSGGSSVSVAKNFDDTWDEVLAYLKKQGQAIDTANRQTGEILTVITTSGGRTQTGRRVQIAITRAGPAASTVRVAVTTQTRKGAAESWGEPKIDARQSKRAADELRDALGG